MADSAKNGKADKTANKTSKGTGFFKGVKAEFKKISWPDKESLLKQSVAVGCISVVMGIVIALLDFLMRFGVNFLTSL
ncbi:MAG: preprotein translocase subunit SecE [Lachnospiraceae bacterium]|nr:preprotein translocase subunit SecE [Lachnospiraceae bacterium]